MSEQFFLVGHAENPRAWRFGLPRTEAGEEVNELEFTDGVSSGIAGPLSLSLRNGGCPQDFTFGPMGIPVVMEWVGDMIEKVVGNEVQRIPAKIIDRPERVEILNITSVRWCVDEAKSKVVRDIDKNGQEDYKSIWDLRVDPARTNGAKIFRLGGYTVMVIISNEMRALLEARNVTGIRYLDVTS